MKTISFTLTLLVPVACAVLRTAIAGQSSLLWPEPTTFHRPGTCWWWMGSAVDEENLTWNLETMREAGMGGGTIVAIYGVKGREDQYVKHLSPRWIDLMSHAVREAGRLGMWLDMTPGTGWPYGGPMITAAACDATVNPLFPALRSGPTAVSGASRQNQIPSNQIPCSLPGPPGERQG